MNLPKVAFKAEIRQFTEGSEHSIYYQIIRTATAEPGTLTLTPPVIGTAGGLSIGKSKGYQSMDAFIAALYENLSKRDFWKPMVNIDAVSIEPTIFSLSDKDKDVHGTGYEGGVFDIMFQRYLNPLITAEISAAVYLGMKIGMKVARVYLEPELDEKEGRWHAYDFESIISITQPELAFFGARSPVEISETFLQGVPPWERPLRRDNEGDRECIYFSIEDSVDSNNSFTNKALWKSGWIQKGVWSLLFSVNLYKNGTQPYLLALKVEQDFRFLWTDKNKQNHSARAFSTYKLLADALGAV